MFGIALARSRRLLSRCRSICSRSGRRSLATFFASLMSSRVAGMLTPTRTARLLATAIILVDGCPSPALGFLFRDTALLVAFGNMIGFAFLFVGVFGLVTTWHACLQLFAKSQTEGSRTVSSSAKRPDVAFENIVIDRGETVVDIAGQIFPLVSGIGDRLAGQAFGQDLRCLVVEPFLERDQHRQAVLLTSTASTDACRCCCAGWTKPGRTSSACRSSRRRDERFPSQRSEKAGYGAIWHGQKSWNGVAILARGAEPIETRRGLPGDPDDSAQPLHRGRGRRHADRLPLPAQRQSGARAEVRLQAALVRAADRSRGGAAGPRTCRSSSPATTTSCRPSSTSTSRSAGSTTPCSGRRCATRFAAGRAGLDRRAAHAPPGRAHLHLLGLFPERLGPQRRPAHRPSAAQPDGGAAARRSRRRPRRARLGEGERPRAGLDRAFEARPFCAPWATSHERHVACKKNRSICSGS